MNPREKIQIPKYRIQISFPKSLLEEKDSNLDSKWSAQKKDSNLQGNGSESLKRKSEDFEEKAKGFESSKKDLNLQEDF